MKGTLEYINDECLVYERGTCIVCGEYAPIDIYGEDDMRICVDCVTEMLHDEGVWEAVINYRER